MRRLSYKKVFLITALATLVFVFLPLAGTFINSQQTISLLPDTAFAQVSQQDLNNLPIVTPPAVTAAQNAIPGNATAPSTAAPVQTPQNPFECDLSTLDTCIPYFLFYLISALGGVLISFGAMLVSWLIQFNQGVFSSNMVQTGFSVCLSIANLGFVLGIIVIAIATILRNQSYGMKQLLWKLVVMAILVNFGLVIARPIVGVSDSLSNYFLQYISGGGSSGPNGLATALVGLFSPAKILNGAASAATSSSGAANDFMAGMISLFFSIIICAVMFIALLALAVLLFVRYVYLAILLIVLPFAWLMWVFPKFSGQFSKWWDNFIKWTFFPAVALFFMYLVILTLQNAATLPAVSPTAATDPSNPASTFLNATNNVNGGSQGVSFLQQALDDLALAALMIGGLFAAESLTGSIGKTAVSTAKSAAGWVGGVAGKATARQGKKVAARAVPEGLRNKLQSGQLGGIGRIVPKRLQVAAGIGLANVQKAGTSRLVDQESTWAKEQGKDVDAAHRMLSSGGLSEVKQFALLKELNNNKKLDPTKKIDGQDIGTFLKDKSRFDKYGQGSLRDDLNKSINGASSSTMAASSALAAAGGLASGATVKDDAGILGEAGKTVDALELLQKSIEKTTRTLDAGAVKKENLNYMYSNDTLKNGPDRDLRKEQLRALIKTKPQLISSHLPGMSSQQIDNFSALINEVIEEDLNKAVKTDTDINGYKDKDGKVVEKGRLAEVQDEINAKGVGTKADYDKIAALQATVAQNKAFLDRLGEVQKSFNKNYSRISSGDWIAPSEDEGKKPDEPAPAGTGEKK